MEASTLFYYCLAFFTAFGPILVQGSGIFELRLESFQSHLLTADRTGTCCKDQHGQCSERCNTYFRVCLKHYQTSITPDPPCTFGSMQTKAVTTEDGAKTFPEQNSVIPFPFNFTWPETFSLIVEAWHKPQSSQPDNFFGEDNTGAMNHQLLAQLTAHRNLKADANWTESTFTANSSQLTFSYRVVCDEKYYGAGCADLCRPRDDGFGHYTCTENGTRVCLDGWTGPYCTQAVCAPGCNAQRGYCDVPFECKCRSGWQGKDCSECIRYPGCKKGTCQMPWQCNCDEGWGGLFCDQDLNYCTHHRPCGNGGTCTNTGQGSYTCKCQDEFTGPNCEVRKDQCEVEPCLNSGACRSTGPGNYTCDCQDGFIGRHCEIPSKSCSDAPCLNQAACRPSPTKGYVCACRPGYHGRNCEHDRDDCATQPCLNGGRCLDLVDSFACTCLPGFHGATCQLSKRPRNTKTSALVNAGVQTHNCHNPVSPCLNGGTCPANGHTCVCPPGFSGPTCRGSVYDRCADSPCQNGASCEDLEQGAGFVCHCPQAFGGRLCDVSEESNAVSGEDIKASTARLEAGSEGDSWTGIQLAMIVGCVVLCTIFLLLVIAFVCSRRRGGGRHVKAAARDPLAGVTYNMNNIPKTSPTYASCTTWKPQAPVLHQVSECLPEEDHYKALPKRNNSNVYDGGHCGSPSSGSSSPEQDVYMKVMVTPPPSYVESNYQTPRRLYPSMSAGARMMTQPGQPERFAEYELAENVRSSRQQSVC
ncbi:Delta-like protein 1 [Hypsibius exemplaris]|uniref:Delta-like protein n=1 Tax=Hypsibius exemplaris TaxID=2072580 RepID=A0A1W0X7H7_HYPEX|nr:Delta-like protein 1 [Hypsibius exemplaris]